MAYSPQNSSTAATTPRAQNSQPMGFLAGKRGATTAPRVEKPTAMTASSAHSSKTGAPGSASRLRTNRSSPVAARAKETAHKDHESHAAPLVPLLLVSRFRANRGVPFRQFRRPHATGNARATH